MTTTRTDYAQALADFTAYAKVDIGEARTSLETALKYAEHPEDRKHIRSALDRLEAAEEALKWVQA